MPGCRTYQPDFQLVHPSKFDFTDKFQVFEACLCRILSLRAKLLGGNCQPLLVIGPRALYRVLQSIGKLQHLAMHFIENAQTVEHASHTLNVAYFADKLLLPVQTDCIKVHLSVLGSKIGACSLGLFRHSKLQCQHNRHCPLLKSFEQIFHPVCEEAS